MPWPIASCNRTRRRWRADGQDLWACAPRPGRPRSRSTLADHDLQVFAWQHHAAVVGTVHGPDQGDEIAPQCLLAGAVECGKGLEHRAIVGLEHVQEVLRRAVAKSEMARLCLDRGGSRPEQL